MRVVHGPGFEVVDVKEIGVIDDNVSLDEMNAKCRLIRPDVQFK